MVYYGQTMVKQSLALNVHGPTLRWRFGVALLEGTNQQIDDFLFDAVRHLMAVVNQVLGQRKRTGG